MDQDRQPLPPQAMPIVADPAMPNMDDLRAMAATLDEIDAILVRLDEETDGDAEEAS